MGVIISWAADSCNLRERPAQMSGVQLFRYVDLFAGCGGLSLGLENAGGKSVLAVEKSDMAAQTYYRNFIDADVDADDWRRYLEQSLSKQVRSGLVVSELRNVLDARGLDLSDLEIDVVVGGPPCQGFSLAGRRNPADMRNKLPWEFLEFVERTRPRVVVIENVVGMSRSFAGSPMSTFQQVQMALQDTEPGYVVQGLAVNAKHFGAPQHRPRLMILGVRKDLAETLGVSASERPWVSGYIDEVEPIALSPVPTLRSQDERTVGDAVGDLLLQQEQVGGNSSYRDTLAGLLVPANGSTKSDGIANHVPRKHTTQVIGRFRLYQWLSREGISHRVVGTLNYGTTDASGAAAEQLRRAVYPAVAPDGTVLAADAEEMQSVIRSFATRKHSQKALRWDEPAKTVVTLPDDYVHPSEPRILTVRELARFQGFPDDFVFMGRETTGAHRRRFEVPQYSQVGNAVSPFLGLAIGKLIDRLVDDSRGGSEPESSE